MTWPRGFRSRTVLEQHIAALTQAARSAPPAAAGAEFHRGARAALRWLLEDGPGPLTGATTTQPPLSTAMVQELAAAEELIHQRRSPRREYGRGVQHALMWAQYATATPPTPLRSAPPAPRPPGPP